MYAEQCPTSARALSVVSVAFLFSELPFSPQDASGEVCLIVRDPQRKWKDLVAAAQPSLSFVSRVISYRKLQKKFPQFADKRNLCSSFDLFMVDTTVKEKVYNTLGKAFFSTNKYAQRTTFFLILLVLMLQLRRILPLFLMLLLLQMMLLLTLLLAVLLLMLLVLLVFLLPWALAAVSAFVPKHYLYCHVHLPDFCLPICFFCFCTFISSCICVCYHSFPVVAAVGQICV